MSRASKQATANSRIRQERKIRKQDEELKLVEETVRWERFQTYWSQLDCREQAVFEELALRSADPMKQDGYRRNAGRALSEKYRQQILRDHYERKQSTRI